MTLLWGSLAVIAFFGTILAVDFIEERRDQRRRWPNGKPEGRR